MKNLKDVLHLEERWQVRGIGGVIEPIASEGKAEKVEENSFTTFHLFYLTALIEAKMRSILDSTRHFKLEDHVE